jgi:hypothetical protein
MEQQSFVSFIPSPLFFLTKINNKHASQKKDSSIDQACKVETNLTSGREV